VIVTIGQLVTCTLAAFAFARLQFRAATRCSSPFGRADVPAQVTILPALSRLCKIGLLNKPIGLALMYLTSSFGVFLNAPVHAEPAEGPGRGGADGRSRLSQDLLAHLPAPAEARRFRRSHYHLHPDLELLFPGQRCCSARRTP